MEATRAGSHNAEKETGLTVMATRSHCAERTCGQLLAETEKAKGGWASSEKSCSRAARPQVEQPKTLAEMGVSKDRSSREGL